MDEASSKASNPSFAHAARVRVLKRYIDPENSVTGVFKDPAASAAKKEPEVQEQELGVNFFG